ncbi:hypothetical protein KL930_003483 [Ogataea haglerorum]|uniref:Cytochrome P450 n=1 Tax=Ogataea haglerorum TaxID=1937702 RepID=A0ABQ7RF97_9ASCO|nr:uncharacterized protein KL911_003075 [Ogataea haglerorum]KAG7695486.1 hypothetical protein KL915_002876 [Ogataea haglerorum]KAG7705761.1 hypothetical protein KL914_003599 [Ogataea haglerorum]KAG7707221.1 hypothetical protein KL950_002881 [Ogataea haglerorum]KAG7718485.1 hypothetical protein KL913_002480 [Ogataea haglerorum]KAG7718666.1 hypothetical protein KL949_002662 [Ogataea haglerorum]
MDLLIPAISRIANALLMHMSQLELSLIAALLLLALVAADYIYIRPHRIKNLPSVPWMIPFWGNLSILFPQAHNYTQSPCSRFAELAQKHGDVFQVRLGTRTVVVANSYDSILQLWCYHNIRNNNSRPILHTFHGVLSQSKVFTVGTTPFGESYLKSRKYMSSKLLNESSNRKYNSSIIDKEATKLVRYMLSRTTDDIVEMDITRDCQYFHLGVALILTYGYEINARANRDEQELADEMVYVENYITKIRSHIQNVQDYLPWYLRLVFDIFHGKSKFARELYHRRNSYLYKFSQFTTSRLDMPDEYVRRSLIFNYVKNNDQELLNGSQLGSICLTMVSAGLDNTPLNFQYAMMQLSESPHIRANARAKLLECYNNNSIEAWNKCHADVLCPYVVAIVKETLRLFTVLPMSLPRETTRDIVVGDAVIPRGTTLFMNAWAGNHDRTRFFKPMEFIPERWLDPETGTVDTNLRHFSFGVGSRMCLGNNLAFKELYVLICKFLLMFEIEAAKEQSPSLHPLELNQFPESIAIEPIETHVRYTVNDKTLQEYVEGVYT